MRKHIKWTHNIRVDIPSSKRPSRTKAPSHCPRCGKLLSKYNRNYLCYPCLVKRRSNHKDLKQVGHEQRRSRGATWEDYI